MQGKKFAVGVFAALAGALCGTPVARASSPVVFGNFEGAQSDNWGWFNTNGFTIDPFATNSGVTYSYGPTGATNGTTALSVDVGGFRSFDLAYDFLGNGHTADFLNNDIISFDMTFPTSATSAGYAQVYSLVLNSDKGGFKQVGDAPLANQYPPYDGSVNHVSINYDDYKANVGTSPQWLQLFLSTNNGGGAPSAIYVDNFSLSTVAPPVYPGDADDSGFVDATDFGILVNNYLTSTVNGHHDGDFDGSGFVDSTDFGILVNNYLTGSNPPPGAALEPSVAQLVAAIPEPTSLALLAAAPVLLMRRRRG